MKWRLERELFDGPRQYSFATDKGHHIVLDVAADRTFDPQEPNFPLCGIATPIGSRRDLARK